MDALYGSLYGMSETKSFRVEVTGELKLYNFDTDRSLAMTGPCTVSVERHFTRTIYRFIPDVQKDAVWEEDVVGMTEEFWQRCCKPNLKRGVLNAADVEATHRARTRTHP